MIINVIWICGNYQKVSTSTNPKICVEAARYFAQVCTINREREKFEYLKLQKLYSIIIIINVI